MGSPKEICPFNWRRPSTDVEVLVYDRRRITRAVLIIELRTCDSKCAFVPEYHNASVYLIEGKDYIDVLC